MPVVTNANFNDLIPTGGGNGCPGGYSKVLNISLTCPISTMILTCGGSGICGEGVCGHKHQFEQLVANTHLAVM